MAEEISPLEDHGWWMERLRKDAKANRPEALRLAAQLEDAESARLHLLPYAAAELRRLVAENERLEAEVLTERTACADICDQHVSIEGIAQRCAEQIRARRKT